MKSRVYGGVRDNLPARGKEPQCFLGCGLQVSGVGISWDLLRKADSPGPIPDTRNQQLWGGGPHSEFHKAPGKGETQFLRERVGGERRAWPGKRMHGLRVRVGGEAMSSHYRLLARAGK